MNFKLTEVKENGVLRVKNYEETLNQVTEIIQSICVPEKIEDEETKKRLKATRATINKLIKTISDRRISIVEEMTSEFQQECKNLTSPLDEFQKLIGQKVKEYENSRKEEIAQAAFSHLSIEVKITTQEMLKKLTNFLAKNGCEYLIKNN